MDPGATTVLLDCLNYAGEAGTAERLSLVSPEEWRTAIALAQRHNVEPLLYHRIERLRVALPATTAEELRQAYLENAIRNTLLVHELGIVVQHLDKQGIRIILLKGAHLAEQVYDDIGLRTMGDVDFLVRTEDVMRVEQVLLALGFEPAEPNRIIGRNNHHFRYSLAGIGLALEVHWTLIGDEGQYSVFPFQIDVPGLWARAHSLTLGDSTALALSPEDLILHLCLHAAAHAHDMQLRMLCDIAEVARRYSSELDWAAIAERARQWGIGRAVYLLLRLAQELLGAAVPLDWLAMQQPAGYDSRYLVTARDEILFYGDTAWAPTPPAARLWGSRDRTGKFTLICKSLSLPRDSMARMYPAPADSWRIWLYYPVRARDMLARHGAAVWRLIRGNGQARVAAERTNEVTALHDWMLSAWTPQSSGHKHSPLVRP